MGSVCWLNNQSLCGTDFLFKKAIWLCKMEGKWASGFFSGKKTKNKPTTTPVVALPSSSAASAAATATSATSATTTSKGGKFQSSKTLQKVDRLPRTASTTTKHPILCSIIEERYVFTKMIYHIKKGHPHLNFLSPSFLHILFDPLFTSSKKYRRTDVDMHVAVSAWCNPDTRAAAEITYGHISAWETSRVTNMEKLFNGDTDFGGDANMQSFNDDISRWDTSNVTTMWRMFNNAHTFNGDLSRWDTSNVTTMFQMFYFAHAFNGDISTWDTSKVTCMEDMFNSCRQFNCDISQWDTSNVTSLGGTFCGCHAFNRDLSAWDTSNVTCMEDTFKNALRFKGDISSWDTSKVTNMKRMFYHASSFCGDIHEWDTSSVSTETNLMDRFHAFHGNFNVNNIFDMLPNMVSGEGSSVTAYTDMFKGCPIVTDYKPLLFH
jgi:surface protein